MEMYTYEWLRWQILWYFDTIKNKIQFKKSSGSAVKNLPEMEETRVQSLDWEDALEKKMTTHSSILAWEIPWTEEPGRL